MPRLSILAIVVASAALPLGAQSLGFAVSSSWSSGYQAAVTLTNGPTAVTSWTIEWTLAGTITSIWDATLTDLGGGRYRIANLGWNGNLAAGGSVSFGFIGSGSSSPPTAACLNGSAVPVNGVPSSGPCTGGTGGGGGGPPPSGGPPNPPALPSPSGRRVVGYFAAWGVYARNFHVADIPADQVTHINYAFANIGPNLLITHGDAYADVDRFYPGDSWAPGALRGSFNQLKKLKAKKPHLQTLISVGGWTWSGRFSDVALTAASRAAFAQSCVDYAVQYGFDGVDIDWEYPVGGGLAGNVTRPQDRQNFTLLLAELRTRLDARGVLDGRSYLLTIAAPAGHTNIANIDLPAIHPYLDWINLMTYDFHGGWESTTNHNAPLFATPMDPSPPPLNTLWNGAAATATYLAAGIPASKLHLGMPMYGRGWTGVPATNNALFQTSTGLPTGTWEAGVFDYEDLEANWVPISIRGFDAAAQVPWLYHPGSSTMISYDDPQSIAAKADFVVNQGLGGAMFWEFSGDNAQAVLGRTISERILGRAPWVQAATSGAGSGDLRLNLYTRPAAGLFIVAAPSATLPAGGLGTGPAFGIVPDAWTWAFLALPRGPDNLLHFAATATPYALGPVDLPAGTLASLAGTSWDLVAATYDASGLLQASRVARLDW